MTVSRWVFLTSMLFSLGWSGNGLAAAKLTSESLTGTWQNEQGGILTFRANSTIIYHSKRYYYAVSSGGFIQLKGKQGDLTIPFQYTGGKLTLTESGKTTLYKRKRKR